MIRTRPQEEKPHPMNKPAFGQTLSQGMLLHDMRRLQDVLFHGYGLPPEGATSEQINAWWQQTYERAPLGCKQYWEIREFLQRTYVDVMQLRMFGALRSNDRFEDALLSMATPEDRWAFSNMVTDRGWRDQMLAACVANNPDPGGLGNARITTTERQTHHLLRKNPNGARQELQGVLAMFRGSGDAQLVQDLHDMASESEVGFYECEWGYILDSPNHKVVLCSALSQADSPSVRTRIYNDWKTYVHPLSVAPFEKRLGQSLGVNLTPFESRTLVLQVESQAEMKHMDLFHEWFTNDFIGRMLPRMCARVLDADFEYPLQCFPDKP